MALAVGAGSHFRRGGYAGVGPNFCRGSCAVVLAICVRRQLVWQARTGGFMQRRNRRRTRAATRAGVGLGQRRLLFNAATITSIGFISSCTLCFVLAVQGLRRRQADGSLKSTWLVDDRDRRRDFGAGVLDVHRSCWRSTCRASPHRRADGSDFCMDIWQPAAAGFPPAATPINLLWACWAARSAPPSACCPASAPVGGGDCCRSPPRWTHGVDDLFRRHLLRRHVRRLDHLDPAEHAGRAGSMVTAMEGNKMAK